jgi:hypothetical protein
VQTGNKDALLSLDFGLREFSMKDAEERLSHYRKFVNEKGGLDSTEKEREKGFEICPVDRFRYRTRYFTDSGIIGTKAFVSRLYQRFKDYFSSKHEKQPETIHGLEGVYSLKRLSEQV